MHIRPEYTIDDFSEASQYVDNTDSILPCESILIAVVLLGTDGMDLTFGTKFQKMSASLKFGKGNRENKWGLILMTII